jgi:hypothetical protein
MRIMGALPLAPRPICPRGALGVAALAEVKHPETETGSDRNELTPAKAIRMRRSLGGRSNVLYVRLTDDEDRQIRHRAAQQGFSAQRFVVEAALSGSAESATERRQAALEVLMTRVVLKGVANNLNQLTKWTNANRALPPHLDHLVEALARAVVTTEETAVALGAAFEIGQSHANGPSKLLPT